ncbi:MAG: ATPase [Bacteroidetes bacterium]|nr:MAG: ATPase [Bacteroidota bacterium]
MNKTNIIAEPGKQEIIITRLFDAPRELIYKVITDPINIPKWWGPKYLTTFVDKMEVIPGGMWRYIQHDKQGNEFTFHGFYHQISKPERLVYTFEFEGIPGHILLETITFKDMNGQTIMTDKSVFQSVEDRDGMLQSGMETGADETMERLNELLHSIKQ